MADAYDRPHPQATLRRAAAKEARGCQKNSAFCHRERAYHLHDSVGNLHFRQGQVFPLAASAPGLARVIRAEICVDFRFLWGISAQRPAPYPLRHSTFSASSNLSTKLLIPSVVPTSNLRRLRSACLHATLRFASIDIVPRRQITKRPGNA